MGVRLPSKRTLLADKPAKIFEETLKTIIATTIFLCAHAAFSQAPSGAPPNSSGICKDGTYSTAAVKDGACRGHKGVQTWYKATLPFPPRARPRQRSPPFPSPHHRASDHGISAPTPGSSPSMPAATTRVHPRSLIPRPPRPPPHLLRNPYQPRTPVPPRCQLPSQASPTNVPASWSSPRRARRRSPASSGSTARARSTTAPGHRLLRQDQVRIVHDRSRRPKAEGAPPKPQQAL